MSSALQSVERGLLSAVESERLNMNGGNRNDVGVVFGVEVVKIGLVLEVVCQHGSVLHNIVGNDIITEFLNIEVYVLFGKDTLCNGKYLGMGCGRSGNRNGFARKRGIIDR